MIDETKIKKIAQQVFDNSLTESQYGVSPIPYHTHNGTDSPQIQGGSSSVGGSSGDVQFNNSGKASGDGQFTYSPDTGVVHLHDIDNRLDAPNDSFELSLTSINGQRLVLTTNNIDSDGNPLGTTGDVVLASNDAVADSNTGTVNITTGNNSLDGSGKSSGTTGNIAIKTGESNTAGGDIILRTSDVTGNPANGATSGDITLRTGFAYGDAGNINIQSGNSSSGNDGGVSILTNNGGISIYTQGGTGSGGGDIFVGSTNGAVVLQAISSAIILQYYLNIQDSSAPSTPGDGGTLYVQSGALKYKGSSGTVTTLAPA